MNYSAELHLLSEKFAHAYPHSKFPEILYKAGRAYNCLLIDTHINFFICVPFRSDIKHSNAFLFSDTERSRKFRSGLDYSKIVIISNLNYIDSSAPVIVDLDEYQEMIRNMDKIVTDADDYVNTYINHVTGLAPIHPQRYLRKYQFSTLPYFHDVMGI